LWFGYIYYLFFILAMIVLVAFSFRVSLLTSTSSQTSFRSLLFYLLISLNFVVLLSTIVLYNIFYNYSSILVGYSFKKSEISYYSNLLKPSHSYLNFCDLHYASVYYFPFTYIFILITFVSLYYCLSYNVNELSTFSVFCLIILLSGYILFYTDSLILFFVSYEALLLPSFFILYKFAKTRRSVEAAYLMFFWTQFGAMFLIFGLLYLFFVTGCSSFYQISLTSLNKSEVNFLFLTLLIGFGVKLPLWPFYGWLPKAHVEASTNFSIFLSGVLVKFAFFGFLKILLVIQLDPTFYFIYPFLTIGICDSVFKLFYQTDLKKLVAYSTVVEMHWLTICIVSGHSSLMLAGFSMLISHALLSTNSFLLVDAIGRRFKTRLVTEIGGVNFLCPKLFYVSLLNLLIFLGFPGTIMFISEILFFSFFFDLHPTLYFVYLFLLYLLGPTVFFRTWLIALFGNSSYLSKTIPADLNSRELLIFSALISLMTWLGVSWQSLLF
jgi:NADH:ubiquinone oxidoreductase subunit 4 (subunit M)